MDTPRRWVFSTSNGLIPFYAGGRSHFFNLTDHLPHRGAIAYYSLSDVINYMLSGWTHYMHNVLGDTSFGAYVYVGNRGPRVFFSSTTYGLKNIRLAIRRLADGYPNALDLILRHIVIGGAERDVSQAGAGYADGESFHIFSRKTTGFQNNANFMTFHCNELTQFRKSDSISPTDGNSLIAICTPVDHSDQNDAGRAYIYKVSKGTLVAPKVFFDRNQVLTQFEVVARAATENGAFSEILKASYTEVNTTMQLTLIIRAW
jgi:hypothetical protein